MLDVRFARCSKYLAGIFYVIKPALATRIILIYGMIIGIGIDLVDIRRIERAYARFGDRFLRRFLTPEEMSSPHCPQAHYLAGRFAAREAAVKALGTGFANGIGPLSIRIGNNSRGKPELEFLGDAAKLARDMGARKIHLSISHERTMAAAIVLLED